MKNSEFVKIIDLAFDGMIERKEETVIVHYFTDVQQIVFSPENVVSCEFAKIIMRCLVNQVRVIKVLYGDDNIHEALFFTTDEEKNIAVKTLLLNNIMPTPEKWSEATSLLNMSGVVQAIGGCDYEDAITESARQYLKKH